MIRRMELGVVFPQTESGGDPAAIQEYISAVEGAGFDFLVAFDHVLGANPERPDRLTGPYTHHDPFQEVLVLLGWAAGLTTRIGLATEVLVLPQRQTALVAKQAAEVAVLSGGRLRLGVGIGWNHVEYEALGMSWRDRSARYEEQIDVLRRLWADDLVVFEGRWHRIADAGIKPRPPGGTIPLWMGGSAEPARRRIARLADGWMLNGGLNDKKRADIQEMRAWVAENGRDPAAFGIAGRVGWTGDLEALVGEIAEWRHLGASHVSVNTMNAGLPDLTAHVDVLLEVIEAWKEA
jgi:probable F420-dependent oxidoreductase